jgi:hypothetical protein
VLDDPGRSAELTAAGEQRASEFSMRHLAERFIALYEVAMAHHVVAR